MRLRYLHEGQGFLSWIPKDRLHLMANALALGLGEILEQRLRPLLRERGDDLTVEANTGDTDDDASLVVSTDLGEEVELQIRSGSVFVGGYSSSFEYGRTRPSGGAAEERSLEEDEVIDAIVDAVKNRLGI